MVSISNTIQTEIALVIATIKRQLKSQGLTYRDVAQALDLSEASVKRLFASERFTVERLAQISQMLGFTMAEMLQEASLASPLLDALTNSQEAKLVSDQKLLLVAVCVLNHWSVDNILAAYRITRAEAIKRLMVLDSMGLIALLPGDRIRLCVRRDFDWLPHGPIRHFFLQQGLNDFLNDRFERDDEALAFGHGMLSAPALAQLNLELRRLRAKLATLHEESACAPLSQKRGVGLLLALREWEPVGFEKLRRN